MLYATIALLTFVTPVTAAPSAEGVPTLLNSAIALNNARADRLRAESVLAQSTCEALAWLVDEGAVAEQSLRNSTHDLHRLALVATAIQQHAQTLDQLRSNCRAPSAQVAAETLVIWLRPTDQHGPAVAIRGTWNQDPHLTSQLNQIAQGVAAATGEADMFRAETRFLRDYIDRLTEAGSFQFAREIARKSMLLEISASRAALALARADYLSQTERTHAPDNQTTWPLQIDGRSIASAAALSAHIDRDWHNALGQNQLAGDRRVPRDLGADWESRHARNRIAQLRSIAQHDPVAEVQLNRTQLRLAIADARRVSVEQRLELQQHLATLQQPLTASRGGQHALWETRRDEPVRPTSVLAFFKAAAAHTGSIQLAEAEIQEAISRAEAIQSLYKEECASWAEWRSAQRDVAIAKARHKMATEQVAIARLKFKFVTHIFQQTAQTSQFRLAGIGEAGTDLAGRLAPLRFHRTTDEGQK